MKKVNIAACLSVVLFTVVPTALTAAQTNPAKCHEKASSTDAGTIHFEFIKQYQLLPGLSQSIASTDPATSSFELKNGSKWSVGNIHAIQGWNENDQIVIGQNQAFFSTHRFALVNLALDKALPITLLREPRPTADDALFITKIDLANDIAVLNGQQWAVDSSDHAILKRFSEHDRILLGINTSECCDQEKVMGYILLDTATQQCVRATPLNR